MELPPFTMQFPDNDFASFIRMLTGPPPETKEIKAAIDKTMESLNIRNKCIFVRNAIAKLLASKNAPKCIRDVSRRIMMDRTCSCLRGTQMHESTLAVLDHHLLVNFPISCGLLQRTKEFRQFERKLPTAEELGQYLQRLARMEEDPDSFCTDEKKRLPAKGVSQAKRTVATAKLSCGLCKSAINKGDGVIVLPGCQHTFHASGVECLGKEGWNVLKWLQQSSECPLCKNTVSFL